MTRYSTHHLKNYVRDNVLSVADLVEMLELEIEDILEAFPYKLREHQDKLGIVGTDPEDIEEDDPYELEEDETFKDDE